MIRLQQVETSNWANNDVAERGSRMLKTAQELDRRTLRGIPFQTACDQLRAAPGKYPTALLDCSEGLLAVASSFRSEAPARAAVVAGNDSGRRRGHRGWQPHCDFQGHHAHGNADRASPKLRPDPRSARANPGAGAARFVRRLSRRGCACRSAYGAHQRREATSWRWTISRPTSSCWKIC